VILNKLLTGATNSVHTDDQPGFNDPVHTCLVYLSSHNIDFKGGELYFHKENMTIEPKRCMLVFFEGNTDRPHEVLEVLSGIRENITLQFTAKV
jgi:Rps23 Pro-64 3,4-dihydroxylase Tpa1-like proline 4-hydroxylase